MMETRRIRLREVTREDWPTIFAWRNTESFRYYVRSNDDVVTYPDFCNEFTKASAARLFQFIVETAQQGESIGLAYVHSVSTERSHCFLNIFISDPYVGRGYAVDVFLLISTLVLTKTTINRVYVQAFSYNAFSISALRGANLPEAATDEIRRHHGKEYGVHRFYVTHEHLGWISQLLDALSRAKKARTPSGEA